MKILKGVLIMFLTIIICGGVTFCILYFNIEPEIDINGNKDIVLDVGNEYIEIGALASILGKDVTDDIKIIGNVDTNRVGSYKIKYEITNKFIKKKNYVTRTISVVDSINPEIKLEGNKVNIYVGDNYTEPGYKASDNYDGDITDKVIVTNKVDNTKVGKYEILYSVVDSSDNKTEIKREVEVETRPVVKTSSSSSYSGYGIPVLMYHFFYDASKGQNGSDSNWMEISAFEEQMKYLDENDYYFPTWDELVDFVDGKIVLPKKSIVITADDGDNSFFDLAIPIINKYDVKVTSFIVTSWTPEGVLNKYRSDKINFQTHTHNMHKGGCSGGHGGLFRCIAYDKGFDDLSKSVEILGSKDAIAYPFGDVTDNVLKVTKNVGVKLGFTTKYGKVYKGMNKLQLPRVRMNKGISLKGFINSIS